MKKIIAGLFLAFLISAVLFGAAQKKSNDISASLVRLHVVANSDSEADQALKLQVRDAITKECGAYFDGACSKEEAEAIILSHKDDIEAVAEETLRENGSPDSVTVTYQKTAFPTKHYGNFSLPAGQYDALNVKLGRAEGQNWWCVLFPPLCFVDAASGALPPESELLLRENLGEATYALLSEEGQEGDPGIKLRFKLLEYVGGITARAMEK